MLADTNKFRTIVLPYLARPDLKDFPLVLSSVGRWEGEEYDVITAANDAGHPIKCAILLNVSETEVKKRWEGARALQDRGQREDDRERKVLDTRIEEFIKKTMPVIETYRKDVTVKIHTGDRDRKAKLVEKQKRGKARMKRFGKVDIPSEAFTVMLKRD